MTKTARHLLTMLLAVVAAMTIAPSSATALELAPPPTQPKPTLWAGLETKCIGPDGETPAATWTVSNTTNGNHVMSFMRDGSLVYDTVVKAGETKSGTVSSPQWEDSYQFFAIVWKFNDTTLAQIKPWFNCVEPELAVSYGEVDAQGQACAGTTAVTIANSGTQNAQVRLYSAPQVAHLQFAVKTGSSVTIELDTLDGDHISGTYLNHGSHEVFFETKVVLCPEPLPDPLPEPEPEPKPGDEGGGGGGGGPVNDDPSETETTLESEVETETETETEDADATPDDERDTEVAEAVLSADQALESDSATSGSGSRLLWLLLALLLAGGVGTLLLRRAQTATRSAERGDAA